MNTKQMTEQVSDEVLQILKDALDNPQSDLHRLVVRVVSRAIDKSRLEETPIANIEDTSYVQNLVEMRPYSEDPQFMTAYIASDFVHDTQSIILKNYHYGTYVSISEAELLVKGLTNYIKSYSQQDVDTINKKLEAVRQKLQEQRNQEREQRRLQKEQRKARKTAS